MCPTGSFNNHPSLKRGFTLLQVSEYLTVFRMSFFGREGTFGTVNQQKLNQLIKKVESMLEPEEKYYRP